MNEQDLRLLVRAAVARQLSGGAGAGARAHVKAVAPPAPLAHVHLPVFSSRTLYTGLVNVGDACVIEPAVPCDHCGYCKSHGY